MALPSVDYAQRDPAADVLHRVVREHLQTFLAEAAYLRDGEGVPRFVEEEFQSFLSCGWLAGGFARFQCAAVRVPAGQRDRLERVCRYALRPPVVGARLQLTPDGQVVLQLRHAWADGMTHVAFTPTAFLARLAVLVPRPHVNLVLYHALLAPRAACRVARGGGAAPRPAGHR